jgi:translation initiation factor 2B subunit (eIF-2B alpha/beta/delta family)
LSFALADDATVLVVGWPEVIARALVRRGDIEVLAVDAHGEGSGFARRLEQGDACAAAVPCEGLAAAVAASDVVLLEASAIGPQQFVAIAGSFAAAAVARALDVPVWLVGGVGRVLPARVFDAVALRVADASEPWYDEDELVPTDFVDHIVGPAGVLPSAQALRDGACPIAPELLGTLDTA